MAIFFMRFTLQCVVLGNKISTWAVLLNLLYNTLIFRTDHIGCDKDLFEHLPRNVIILFEMKMLAKGTTEQSQ